MSLTAADIEKLPYRPCVGLMLLNADGMIFTGQRRDQMLEAWQMPQGGIDEGESPREAALRELGEEIGLQPGDVEILRESAAWIPYSLPVDLAPKLWGGRYRGQNQRWFALRLASEESAINIDTEEPEFRDWKWMNARDLATHAAPFKRRTYELVLSEFADLIS